MTHFISHCFYIFGLAFFFYEFTHLFYSYAEFQKRDVWLKSLTDLMNSKDGEKFSAPQKTGCIFYVLALSYVLWSWLGLFLSQQHALFGAMTVLSIFLSIFGKIFGHKVLYFIIWKLDVILTLAVIGLLIFNHFNFVLDFDKYFISLFQ